MSSCDYYEPDPPLSCPVCGRELEHWYGYQGPSENFVWCQGETDPVDQRIDEEVRLSSDQRFGLRLPDMFTIFSDDCACPFPVAAIGKTHHGTWDTTEIVTADNAVQWPEERRGDFKRRLKWLQEGRRLTRRCS